MIFEAVGGQQVPPGDLIRELEELSLTKLPSPAPSDTNSWGSAATGTSTPDDSLLIVGPHSPPPAEHGECCDMWTTEQHNSGSGSAIHYDCLKHRCQIPEDLNLQNASVRTFALTKMLTAYSWILCSEFYSSYSQVNMIHTFWLVYWQLVLLPLQRNVLAFLSHRAPWRRPERKKQLKWCGITTRIMEALQWLSEGDRMSRCRLSWESLCFLGNKRVPGT